MAHLSLKDVTKIYDGDVLAVEQADFQIPDESFTVLVGPSGCGKSTILRMIAGLEEITEGDIYIDDERINDIPPKDRDIAMVFQNYALYPHMTVYKNMAFGLKTSEISESGDRGACQRSSGDSEYLAPLEPKTEASFRWGTPTRRCR